MIINEISKIFTKSKVFERQTPQSFIKNTKMPDTKTMPNISNIDKKPCTFKQNHFCGIKLQSNALSVFSTISENIIVLLSRSIGLR